jgi:oligopeptide/dipeptide ABC transporter ATP-binding protein|tara:strand:+ start:23 stop:1015 length:993 start_codon:yes stop_codon:yes gene_type:complete
MIDKTDIEFQTDELLRIDNLHTHFFSKEGVVKAANGVDLSVRQNSILGIVGESGSGKTVTVLSMLRLIPYPGEIIRGSVYFKGLDLLSVDEEQLLTIRGRHISMIFQDPKGSLNPLETIGDQISEIILAHEMVSIQEAIDRTRDLLREVDLPQQVFNQYPFQISGGMAQRAMIAMATAWRPDLLIADEPTSNLDMTIQADILNRLKEMQNQNKSSIILITHNLGVIAQMADQLAVMYGGSIMEVGDTVSLFEHPMHPYTLGLMQSVVRLDQANKRLNPIPGNPINPFNMTDQCPYLSRCPKASNECRLNRKPPLVEVSTGHKVACYNMID